MKAKQGIKKAFVNQIEGKGFSMVELLSSCPTNWGMTPANALKWIETDMIAEYPLGEFKSEGGK
jgi:2-oxoglutarate ferredoxin oxidoreductase subunit beta